MVFATFFYDNENYSYELISINPNQNTIDYKNPRIFIQSNAIKCYQLSCTGQLQALDKLKQYKVILESGGEEGFSDKHE